MFCRFNTQPPEGGWPPESVMVYKSAICFNTQPPEGGWLNSIKQMLQSLLFQHTAARRRLGFQGQKSRRFWLSFNTQPPEGGWSTTKAVLPVIGCFNTQPPEGGWQLVAGGNAAADCFNTQPPEGGWAGNFWADCVGQVSTHSRPKAAGSIRIVYDRRA